MLAPGLPAGVAAREVTTPRLRHHVLVSGEGDGPVVVFVHAARAGGGSVREEVLAECGHSPHLEHPARFRELLLSFIG